MTITASKLRKVFDPHKIRAAAKLLINQLRRNFLLSGDQGSGEGIFSEVGRGDGSLNDSFREAEPDDDIAHYHDALNALQPAGGPFYVHQRVNRPERKGILIPDIPTDGQMGSNQADHSRYDVAVLTVAIFLQTFFFLGHKPGLIIPGKKQGAQLFPADCGNEGALLKVLSEMETTEQKNGLESCLMAAEQMAANLQFAIVVSDFMSPDWEQKLYNIGNRLELIVFQIIDPTDIELLDVRGQRPVENDGKVVLVDMSTKRARRNYLKEASEKQAEIVQAIEDARGQHYTLRTDGEEPDEQLLRIFRESPDKFMCHVA